MDFWLIKCSKGQRRMDFSLKRCNTNRLGSLPDELLCQILSSLLTKDAAVACLSFRNMRTAFVRMISLDFDDSPISYCASNHPQFIERFPSFKMFVDNVLRSSQSPHLCRFRLRFGGDWKIRSRHFYRPSNICGVGCFPDLESTQINTWISFPLSHSVLEINLCIHVRKPGKLPSALFACETLEVLKLDTNLDFESVSSMTSFRLPKLKALLLRSILIPEDDFVTRLVSSCPSLEDLYMDCWWKYGKSVTISSPSLKKLALYLNRGDEYSDLISIDTPNLRHWKYTDLLAVRYSIASMMSLAGASFHPWNNLGSDEESFDSMLTLLRSVSNAQQLSLQVSCVQVLDHDELKKQLPVFHNLKHLKLGYNIYIFSRWYIVLLEFLKCSPLLETLGFPRGIIVKPHPEPCDDELNIAQLERQFFRSNQVIPSCCNSYLKRIFIKKCWASEREVELIGFLLKIASVLDELLVVCNDNVDKLSFETTLNELPRASSTCLIIIQ